MRLLREVTAKLTSRPNMWRRSSPIWLWHMCPDGVWYNKVDEWEEYINTNSEGEASLVIYLDKFYKPTEVIGEDIYDPDIDNDKIIYKDYNRKENSELVIGILSEKITLDFKFGREIQQVKNNIN